MWLWLFSTVVSTNGPRMPVVAGSSRRAMTTPPVAIHRCLRGAWPFAAFPEIRQQIEPQRGRIVV
jgi:hypothetical protein